MADAAIRDAIDGLRRGEKEIDVRFSEIGAAGAGQIAEELKTNTSATTLKLHGDLIGASGCVLLADALQHANRTLTTLEIEANSIGPRGCAALAKALEANNVLTTLYLGANKIGDEGCTALAKALEKKSSVTSLFLYYNRIGNDGCAALAHALTCNSTLKCLDLGDNHIGDEGAVHLVAALETNTSLHHIDLRENRGICLSTEARILTLLQLSRDGIVDIPRRLVAGLPALLFQEISFSTYKVPMELHTWTFERVARVDPILAALYGLVDNAQ